MRLMSSARLIIVTLLFGLAPVPPVCAQQQDLATSLFGGNYDKLAPQQQELVRRWVDQYDEIMARNLDPKAAYDNLALSSRTTFEAVTSALMKTELTDAETGESMGNALDLVQLVESVHGEIKGSRGDEQYRVYVLLAQDALAKLYRSRQFKRTGDNTIYHIGYPINFRQQGGVPSLQFSVTRTGYRADIDVDYRSSSGPKALVNGHLTAANSDIRAGDNYFRHISRWIGLSHWWSGLVGKQTSIPQEQLQALSSGNTPPRLNASVPLQDAVNDFFQAFLIENKPQAALAYISVKALPCITEFSTGEHSTDGLVRLRIYRRMQLLAASLAPVTSLDQALQGVFIFPAGSVPIDQKFGKVFAMASLPDTIARQLDCRVRQNLQLAAPLPRATSHVGEYFGTASILWDKEHKKGQTLTGVWTKEANAWKLVSYQVGDPFSPSDHLQLTELEPESKPLPASPSVDPALLRTAKTFLADWLIDKQYDRVLPYFAPEALACAQAEQASPVPHGIPKQKVELRAWLTQIGDHAGDGKSLVSLIRPTPFDSSQLQEIDQPSHNAFLLTRVPDDLVSMGSCQAQVSDAPVDRHVGMGPLTFERKVYRVSFMFRKPGSASLTFDFARRDGSWKIVAFDLVTP